MTDQEPTGKGRATPTRAEAEAARRNRVRVPKDPKAARKAMRARQMDERMAQRAALYTGDERLLPTRDQGPIRKRIRQYVDSRLSTGEVFLPVAFLVMIATFSQNATIILWVNTIWTLMLFAVIIDGIWVWFAVRRILRREFPESVRGTAHAGYALVRSLTMRLMRLPKPHYKIGGKPMTPRVPKGYRTK